MREQLEGRRGELWVDREGHERELATEVDGRGEDVTPSQHPADVASDLEGRELTLAHEVAETRDMRDVEEALDRIAAGTYGICVDCGKAIPRERLEILPQAARCVDCERRWERTRAIHRR